MGARNELEREKSSLGIHKVIELVASGTRMTSGLAFATPFFTAHQHQRKVRIRIISGAREYSFPTFFTNTPATMMLFTADYQVARGLMRNVALTPVRIFPTGACARSQAIGTATSATIWLARTAIGILVSDSPPSSVLLRQHGHRWECLCSISR